MLLANAAHADCVMGGAGVFFPGAALRVDEGDGAPVVSVVFRAGSGLVAVGFGELLVGFIDRR
ncbi:hypothetical protein OHB41_50850 [Streptomyces sp. NBC_01571]|uniref:hypothetical protein n=1 Tax=Streptomyces sp. NBC_01571 TaxID=2975883 RepID=UPI0022532525|nr:hypothetical protein [Streptomyces sp. NBC_01571]MCX4581259.1 hypothetical protein [Streptomyces sp. NBC_01571]